MLLHQHATNPLSSRNGASHSSPHYLIQQTPPIISHQDNFYPHSPTCILLSPFQLLCSACQSHTMPAAEGGPQTLYDKVFQDHIVDERLDGTILLYIGNHKLAILVPNEQLLTSRQTGISSTRSLLRQVTSSPRHGPPQANKRRSKLLKA